MGPTVEDFLSACKASPDDDAPWLMFSDWLEERDHEWASYFRRRRWTNSIGMEFVLVPPGKFLMGSPPDEEGRWDCEGPQVEVVIERPFYLAVTTVTQEQWLRVFKKNPSRFKGDSRLPVDSVSWNQAMGFCTRLSKAEGGPVFRLPEEWEWEHACRAGTATRYWCGDKLTNDVAIFNSDKTAPVGGRRPNPWGLFDMHGNVWEWCATPWSSQPRGPDFFIQLPPRRGSSAAAAGSTSPGTAAPRTVTGARRSSGTTSSASAWPQNDGSYRVIRGGSWGSLGQFCRSAIRSRYEPSYRLNDLGFRVASTVEESHDRQ